MICFQNLLYAQEYKKNEHYKTVKLQSYELSEKFGSTVNLSK